MTNTKHTAPTGLDALAAHEQIALILRIGLGSVFVIGGWNKLYQLLSSSLQEKIVASYTGTTGYINQFFTDWMFGADALFSQWGFLTALSAFELIGGLMLLAGLMVRPLALIYAFLMWTFVVSLPVITTPGVEYGGKTYLAPALFVQVRDVALSGLMFVLYNLGSGARALDERLFGAGAVQPLTDWQGLGLLLRLSVGLVFIVGGLFSGMPNIKDFGIPGLLLAILGVGLVAGFGVRVLGALVVALMLYYIANKLNFGKSLIGNLNAVKREFAFIAAGLVLALKGGGERFTVMDLAQRGKDALSLLKTGHNA